MDHQNPDRCYVGRELCLCVPPSDVSDTSSRTKVTDAGLRDKGPGQSDADASDYLWGAQDTIHYLSPVTTARTVCEGDFDYMRFIPYPSPGRLKAMSESESTVSCEEPRIQRTVAIVKPEAMFYKDVVLKTIIDNGFAIVNERTLHLTPEQVAEIYEQYYGCPFFPNIVISVSMGPLLVLAMDGVHAVEKWKDIVGPAKTLKAEWFLPLSARYRFGLHVDMPDQLHASENLKNAARENRFFYPQSILDPILCEGDKIEDYCNLYINPTLLKGLTALVRRKPADPIIFLAEWLLMNNPYQPSTKYGYAMAPT